MRFRRQTATAAHSSRLARSPERLACEHAHNPGESRQFGHLGFGHQWMAVIRRNRECRKRRRLDGFFQFLAGTEGDFLAGLNLNRLSGPRIAAHARFTSLHLKNSEAEDAY